jgi:hypothetical protein
MQKEVNERRQRIEGKAVNNPIVIKYDRDPESGLISRELQSKTKEIEAYSLQLKVD